MQKIARFHPQNKNWGLLFFARNRAEIGILDILVWIKYHKSMKKKKKNKVAKTALSLYQDQLEALTELAWERRVSRSFLIREGIDYILSKRSHNKPRKPK